MTYKFTEEFIEKLHNEEVPGWATIDEICTEADGIEVYFDIIFKSPEGDLYRTSAMAGDSWGWQYYEGGTLVEAFEVTAIEYRERELKR